MGDESGQPAAGSAGADAVRGKERRRNRRVRVGQTVRVRPVDPAYPEEVRKTANVSREGLYFITPTQHYFLGMHVHATVGYREGDPLNREELAEVVRLDKLPNGEYGVALRILLR